MSGLVTAGVLLCGVHIANAQTNIDSGYTVLIPSEVTIDKESGKGSFSVSGKMDAQTELDVTTTSQNNYKLKCGSQFVDYTLDKQSFHIDNIKSANPKNFNEDFNITLANTNTNYSGPYKDRLAFNIQCHKYTYELDMNSILDGVRENERHNYGAVDVYINGVLKAENVSDFKEILNYGDTYEFKNIKATDGHHFVGINSCANTSIKGRIGADTNYLETRRDNPYNLVAPIYFEFNTNKLTINYHANGAQTWHHFDNIIYDVSGKDTAGSEIYLYDKNYSAKYGLGNVSRLKKDGYTAKPGTWVVGKNGTKEVADDTGLAKSQDVAEYCGVLDEFKKNDTVIDLYPIWSPVQSQLNLNANGGTFSDNSTFKTATDKLVYDSTANANISAYTPTRKGYDFEGWYTDETGGTKVYNADGSAVNGTQYWQNNVYQNIEGTNILRGDDGQNMAEHLIYGTGNVVGNVIDNGWVSDSNLQYGKSKKITINSIFTSDDGKKDSTGTYIRIFDDYYSRTNISMDKLIGKRITLSFKIKSDTPMQFEQWGLEGAIYSPYLLKTDSSWKSVTIEALLTKSILTDHRSLVFYSLSTPGSFYIGDVSITLDTDIELFAHWTKKGYSAGTTLNIEGTQYIVIEQKEDDKYLVIRKESIGDKNFQPNYDEDTYLRPDEQNANTYEDSEIDNYLENNWYNSLSFTMKAAIQTTNIKQASYYENLFGYDSEEFKRETGYNGLVYNIINRHAYLPSVSEIGKVVDIKNLNKVKVFLNGTSIWTRDSFQGNAFHAEALFAYNGSLNSSYVGGTKGVRPAFVIDLSKVDYTVTGTVNYK